MPWRSIRQKCLQQTRFSSTFRREQSASVHTSSRLASPPTLRWSSTLSRSPASPESSAANGGNLSSPAPIAQREQLSSELRKNAQLVAEPPPPGNKVRIAGLIRSIRKQRKYAFAHISDGSTFDPIQAILSPENAEDLQNGAYVELEGVWTESPGAGQTHEMQVETVLTLGDADVEASPIQKKAMTVDHLRHYPHLRLRLPLYSLLSRVRNQVISSVHEFYGGGDRLADEAIYVQPPLITSSDCEGAGEVFTVSPKLQTTLHIATEQKEQRHYFREQKYLTVSSQLHLEAFAAGLGDVWTITPAFRAEESDTGRHLAELTMLEFEGRGITDLLELMDGVQRLIQHIVSRLMNHRTSQELLSYYESDKRHQSEERRTPDLQARWKALSQPDWIHISYAEAIDALTAAAERDPTLFERQPTYPEGLKLEHERYIVQNLAGDRPVFVTHYPRNQKPFYMLPNTKNAPDAARDTETVACFDLLLPYGICEVVGGSLREHRLENLIQNMREKGLLSNHTGTESDANYPFLRKGESLGSLSWYTDLRRFGSAPHGGWGLGVERLLMYLTGVTNVRDVVAFPRTYKNCIA